MTEKQRRFCEEYVKSYNAKRAYIAAFHCSENTGTSETQPYILLKKQDIKDYIQQLQREQVERFGDLAEVIARELAQDIVERDEDGKHNAGWQKSVDLLQKQLGLQTNKVDAKVASNDIKINIVNGEDKNE